MDSKFCVFAMYVLCFAIKREMWEDFLMVKLEYLKESPPVPILLLREIADILLSTLFTRALQIFLTEFSGAGAPQ